MYMAGGEWVAAAGEGGIVDRDCNNVTNKHRGGSKILLVVVDVQGAAK